MAENLRKELHEIVAQSRDLLEDLARLGVGEVQLPQLPPELPVCRLDVKGIDEGGEELCRHETLEEIRAELENCRRCALCQGRKTVVFGVGNPHARLVLVGEAPGREEDEKGEPFVGEAGRLLDRILFAMGLAREEVYICNVEKCRPPGNRDPLPEEIAACEPFLKRQLAAIRPELIVTLGRFAAQTLLREATPIGRLRGRWRRVPGHPPDADLSPGFPVAQPVREARGLGGHETSHDPPAPGGVGVAGALHLEGVTKLRRNHRGTMVEILAGIDLEVAAGALTVIVGPSGGGKSTLVRLLNRLDDPSSGRILLDGKPLEKFPVLQLRRQVGLVLQSPWMASGSVLENLQLPFQLRSETPPTGDDPRLGEVLGRCGLSAELLPQEARTLSLGQQQRLSLARTLLPGPSLLVLDEPTSALDRPTGDRLADTLRRISREQQLTVLMVTHDLRLAERIADQLAYLEEGRIWETGSATKLLNHPQNSRLQRFLRGGISAEEA